MQLVSLPEQACRLSRTVPAEKQVKDKEEEVKQEEVVNKSASDEAEWVRRRALAAEAQLCEVQADVKAKQARLDCVTVC